MTILGQPILIRTPPSVHPEACRLLASIAANTTGNRADAADVLTLEADGPGHFRLRDVEGVVLKGIDHATALPSIIWRLNAVAAGASNHVVVHAGCVVGGEGAVVLPGPSGAGKSWLTAELVQQGYRYLSDEHAPIDLDTGLVAPIPKPLDLGRRGFTSVRSLNPAAAPGVDAPPRSLVFPRFVPNASTSLTVLSAAETLVALCGLCTNLATLGATGFLMLADVARRPAALCTYGDATEAARDIDSWVQAHPPGTPAVAGEPLDPVTASTVTVELDGSLVVFAPADAAAHLLNPSAALVWLCASSTADDQDIVDLALAEAPDGAVSATDIAATIGQLRQLKLLPR